MPQQPPHSVDPIVLGGEPGSVHQLEGGDDDLPVVPDEPAHGSREAARQREWAGADSIVVASPTALGE